MNSKKGFTLFEIIISIILVSIIYLFAINSFSKSSNNKSDNINLLNLKSKLTKFEYSKNITIKCIGDDFSCFVFLDDSFEPLEQKIEPFFTDIPTVYEYSKELERVEFLDLQLEQLQRETVIFQYTCKKNNRCSEYIIQSDELVYVFNDIDNKPKVLKYLSDVDEYFESKEQEVKDAF